MIGVNRNSDSKMVVYFFFFEVINLLEILSVFHEFGKKGEEFLTEILCVRS